MMRRALAGLALAASLALSACGWEGKGVITEKTHSDAYTYTTTICAGYSAQGVCTVWVPMVHNVSESWGYKVRDRNGDIHDVTVEKPEWDKAHAGDKFNNEEVR